MDEEDAQAFPPAAAPEAAEPLDIGDACTPRANPDNDYPGTSALVPAGEVGSPPATPTQTQAPKRPAKKRYISYDALHELMIKESDNITEGEDVQQLDDARQEALLQATFDTDAKLHHAAALELAISAATR